MKRPLKEAKAMQERRGGGRGQPRLESQATSSTMMAKPLENNRIHHQHEPLQTSVFWVRPNSEQIYVYQIVGKIDTKKTKEF